MRFVDECSFLVEAGAGGNGAVAFRGEAHVQFGGPSGGDGGDGGSVIFVGDEGKNSLLDLKQARRIAARSGENGKGSDCYGKSAADERIRVPVGTIVIDDETGERVGELLRHGEELVVARGGKGGRGNKHFATPTDRAPRKAEPGTPGVTRHVSLELRVLADVGLLGFPNAGKSTFVAAVSHARPKIADYPFTTLVPQLGVVNLERWISADHGETLVVADIPGLIEGAADGAGIGIRFLRHVKRSRVLLHLLAGDRHVGDDAAPSDDAPGDGVAADGAEADGVGEARDGAGSSDAWTEPEWSDPLADYDVLRRELENFDPELAELPEVVVLTKMDLPHVEARLPELQRRFAERGVELLGLSAATGRGVPLVLERLRTAVRNRPAVPSRAAQRQTHEPA